MMDAEKVAITLHERDIVSRVCQSCGACCRVILPQPKVDSRQRMFLRKVGFNVIPPPQAEDVDCCDKVHDIQIDFGFCRHLTRASDETGVRYSCGIHGREGYPELCSQYNCVSWAKANNSYSDKNPMLRAAQEAFDQG